MCAQQAAAGYDICINGDGLEIAQTSFACMAADVPTVMHTLADLVRQGVQIYDIVGNHDIALEHFLAQWGPLRVCPFLNVHTGDYRIRVEHGHLYDPIFARMPRLYTALTAAAGVALHVAPKAYALWQKAESTLWRSISPKGGRGEAPHFAEAADEISRRGFDAVVFGHTHIVNDLQLPSGDRYLNPGSWLNDTTYALLDETGPRLLRWEPGTPVGPPPIK
ncbi:MAG: UDP-2,3-diacylglucosamine pyrophosphatase LpxH [Myxococcota bacterium]